MMAGEPLRKTRYPANLIQFSDGSRSYEQPEWDTFTKNDVDEDFKAMVSGIICIYLNRKIYSESLYKDSCPSFCQ